MKVHNKMINKVNKRLPRLFVSLLFWATLFLVAGPVQAVAGVSVIAHQSVSLDAITAKEAKKIWLAKTKKINGLTLKLSDLPKGSGSRDYFYSKVVKKSEEKLRAYWAKIVFSGKGVPPKPLSSDDEVVNWVASTPGAMGYVDNAAVNDSVKVLLVGQ